MANAYFLKASEHGTLHHQFQSSRFSQFQRMLITQSTLETMSLVSSQVFQSPLLKTMLVACWLGIQQKMNRISLQFPEQNEVLLASADHDRRQTCWNATHFKLTCLAVAHCTCLLILLYYQATEEWHAQ